MESYLGGTVIAWVHPLSVYVLETGDCIDEFADVPSLKERAVLLKIQSQEPKQPHAYVALSPMPRLILHHSRCPGFGGCKESVGLNGILSLFKQH